MTTEQALQLSQRVHPTDLVARLVYMQARWDACDADDMAAWCEAIMRHVEFRQQMDPLTGDFTQADPSGYSPAALVFLEFARRLGHAPAD